MSSDGKTTNVHPGDLLVIRRDNSRQLVAVLAVYKHALTNAWQANVAVLGKKSIDLNAKMPSEHLAQLLATGDAQLLSRTQ